jgi:chromosome segregation ATPase
MAAERSIEEFRIAAEELRTVSEEQGQRIVDLEHARAADHQRLESLGELQDLTAATLEERELEVAALREGEARLTARIEAAVSECEVVQAREALLATRLAIAERRSEALEGAVRTFLTEAQRAESRLNEILGSRTYRACRRIAAPLRVLGRGSGIRRGEGLDC